MKTILVDAAETFTIQVNGKYIIFNKLHQLLDSYPNRKIILTNANDEQAIEYELVDLPYELFTLKHKPDKTDPEFFKEFLGQYKLKAEELIYFEHNPEAVDSANSVGINSYFYDADKKRPYFTKAIY
jgi:HAD superfamily hydrolase (TIGR01509 family)